MNATTRATINTVDQALTLFGRLVGHADKLVADVTRDSREVVAQAQQFADAVTSGASTVRSAVRGTPRFARIVSELCKVAASYRVQLARAKVSPADERKVIAALHQRNAARVYELCIKLRGGIIKIAQFLSSRPDLLPAAYITELGRLQDQVPPVDSVLIIERVERELGAPIHELFASFDTVPLAAASLAQVHGGTLADGTRVAVKVQVPGIEQILETDLAAMRAFLPMLRGVLPGVDVDTIVEELARSVRAEVDFEAEAGHAEGFAKRFADDPQVVVPRIHRSHSSARVLTMERLDGMSINAFLQRCTSQGKLGAVQADALVSTLVRCFATQLLDHGAFHADPHPGNLMVLPPEARDASAAASRDQERACAEPRLGLLDFGSVHNFDGETQHRLLQLATSVLRRDRGAIAAHMSGLGFVLDDGAATVGHAESGAASGSSRARQDDALASLAIAAVDGFFQASADRDTRARFEQVMAITRDYPLQRVPRDFVLLSRTALTVAGIVSQHRPNLPLLPLLAPQLAQAVRGSRVLPA